MIVISLLFVLLIISSIRFKAGASSWLAPDDTAALKGLLAIGVMFSHMSSKVNNPVNLFSGAACVGTFFFFSGYSLGWCSINKTSFWNDFWKRRFVKVLLPYLCFLFICIFYYFLLHKNLFDDILLPVVVGNPISNSWYVWVILFCYISFWLCFRNVELKPRWRKHRFYCLFLIFVCYIIVISKFTNWPDWWYKTCELFPLGVLVGLHKDYFEKSVKRFFPLYLLVSILFVVFAYLSPAIINRIALISPVFEHLVGFKWLINDFLMGLSVPLLVITISLRLQFQNPITHWLGIYSYEIYLVHGEIFRLYPPPPRGYWLVR